jgi:hypothetical protein
MPPLIERAEEAQIVLVERGGGIYQDDTQIVAGQIGEGLRATGQRQRADPWGIHQHHPFPEPGRRKLHVDVGHVLVVAGVALLRGVIA